MADEVAGDKWVDQRAEAERRLMIFLRDKCEALCDNKNGIAVIRGVPISVAHLRGCVEKAFGLDV